MNFLKNVLTHWHTSVAGLAAGLAVVANSYQAGMNWKQWALAAALTLGGFAATDSSKAVTKTALVALMFLFGSTAMAQTPPPANVPITHVSISAAFNGYDSNGKYQPANIDTFGIAIYRNAAATHGFNVAYEHVAVPSLGQRWELGLGSYWLTLPKVKGLLFDTSNFVVTVSAGAGKLLSTQDGNRFAYTVSPSVTYPIAGHMAWSISYQYLRATGGINGLVNRSVQSVGTGPVIFF